MRVGEDSLVGLQISFIPCDELITLLEGSQSHRRRKLCHFSICADANDLISFQAEIPQSSQTCGDFVVIRCDRPPFPAAQEFRCVKAKHFRIAEIADHATIVRATKRMSRIEQQLETSPIRDFRQASRVARIAPQMDAENSRRLRSDQPLNFVRIQIVRSRVNIAKHRPHTLPRECVRGGGKRERRHNHFARQIECANCKLQTNRRIRNRDAMRHRKMFSDFRFELLHKWAIVRKPISIECRLNASEEPMLVPHIWPTDVQRHPKTTGPPSAFSTPRSVVRGAQYSSSEKNQIIRQRQPRTTCELTARSAAQQPPQYIHTHIPFLSAKNCIVAVVNAV